MATYTAHMMIGESHGYDGGLVHGFEQLNFSENSKCAWIGKKGKHTYCWIPRSPDAMVDDGLLMAAALFLEQSKTGRKLYDLLSPRFDRGRDRIDRIYLYEHTDLNLDQMYDDLMQELQAISDTDGKRPKFMFAISESSSLIRRIEKLKEVPADLEIMTTTHRQERSAFDSQLF